MRHDEDEEDDSMPGQDSFVDVICNMVGILITLVVVVGIRVSQVVIEPVTEVTPVVSQTTTPENLAELEAELTDAIRVRRYAEDEIETAILQARDMRANAELVEMRREQLTLVRAEVEQSIADRRAALDAESQKQFDAQREIAEAQIKLHALTQEQVSLLQMPEEVEEIEAVPTPLSKTVTGEEIHVRLKHGQLAVVPVEALLDEVQARGSSYLRGGLSQRDEASDSYGPIDGFRMRFTAQRYEDDSPEGPVGAPQRTGIAFKCVFLPTSDDIGIPVEQALLPTSAFSSALRARRSAIGAVTVWVYPDSYSEVRALKKAMWEAGVPIAIRPLDQGEHIVGSTFGSRSTAQ